MPKNLFSDIINKVNTESKSTSGDSRLIDLDSGVNAFSPDTPDAMAAIFGSTLKKSFDQFGEMSDDIYLEAGKVTTDMLERVCKIVIRHTSLPANLVHVSLTNYILNIIVNHKVFRDPTQMILSIVLGITVHVTCFFAINASQNNLSPNADREEVRRELKDTVIQGICNDIQHSFASIAKIFNK